MPLLLTPEQAADELAVSRARLYELMAADLIPSVKIGRSRRIPYAALVAYVESLTQRP
jgi:excisionase family DNA binding protein